MKTNIYDHISLISSWNEKRLGQKLWTKSKTHFFLEWETFQAEVMDQIKKAFLLGMRNVSGRSYGPNQNTHFFLEWETFRVEVMDQIKTRISSWNEKRFGQKLWTKSKQAFLLGMRNVSGRSYGPNQNTHFMFQTFYVESHAVYEIM